MRRSTRIVIVTALGLVFGPIVLRSGAAQAAEPQHEVLLTSIEFKPNRLKVAVGDTVKFTNKDKFNHDVYLVRTANRNDVLVPATTIPAGQSVVVTIDQEGLFTLYCTIHGGMTGKITTTDTFELTEEEKKRAAARKVVPPIVKVGEELYWGRAQCYHCHQMGERGDALRGPNHQDLGFRAAARAQKLGLSSATEYIVQSIMDPSAHIVEGYSDDMPKVYQSPINLGEEEIKALVAYLQSQGGEVDTWSINLNPQVLASKLEPSPFNHGNPLRGQRIFQEMGCGSCHTVGNHKAISIAPELTAIGAYRNWTWLSQAVIDPNAEIGANWQDATVYLKPGVSIESDEFAEGDEEFLEEDDDDLESKVDSESSESSESNKPNEPSVGLEAELSSAHGELAKLQERISRLEEKRAALKRGEAGLAEKHPETDAGLRPDGDSAQKKDSVPQEDSEADKDFEFGESIPGILRKNSAEEVTLLVAPDRFATFTGDQVARVVKSKRSRMATNYGELMTFQQIADLVRYLESLKGPKDQPSGAPTNNPLKK